MRYIPSIIATLCGAGIAAYGVYLAKCRIPDWGWIVVGGILLVCAGCAFADDQAKKKV